MGSLTIKDFPSDLVEIECKQCGRHGRYPKAALIEKYGSDIVLPDLLAPRIKRGMAGMSEHQMGNQAPRMGRLPSTLTALALVLALSGCSMMPDMPDLPDMPDMPDAPSWVNPFNWFDDDDDMGSLRKAPGQSTQASSGDKPFPKLTAAPAAKTPSSANSREKLANSLVADRDNARYTDQNLRAGNERMAAAPPPVKRLSPPPPPTVVARAWIRAPEKTEMVAAAPPPPKAPPLQANTAPKRQKVATLLPAGDNLLQVRFRAGSSVLTDQDEIGLKSMVKKVAATETRLQLKAYAEAKGNDTSKARRLSLSRALAVRSFLIENGLRSTRIDVRALGIARDGGAPDRVDIVTLDR